MADETTGVPAADVATDTSKTSTNGVTPSPEPAVTGQKLSPAQAKEILRATAKGPRDDALFPKEEAASDPLFGQDEIANDALFDEPSDEEEVVEPVAEEEKPVEETVTDPEPEVPTTDEEQTETLEEVRQLEAAQRKRLNINRKDENGRYVHNDQDRAILSLSDSEGISLSEARRRIVGEVLPKETETEAEVVPELSVQEIDLKLADLKEKRRTAIKGFDAENQIQLTEEIESLQEQKNLARERTLKLEESRRATEASFAAAVKESMAEAQALFPESATKGAKFNVELTKEVRRLEAAGSPIFKDPEWPLNLAARVALRLGIAPVKPTPAAPATKPAVKKDPAPVARRPVRVVPSPSAGGVSGTLPSNQIAETSKLLAAARAAGNNIEVMRLSKLAIKLAEGRQAVAA